MRIAIIGSGISGLTAAYLLSDEHEVVVFESADYIGGHTNTVDVNWDGKSYAVNTGFIVFNQATYPNFIKLMKRLGVGWQPSKMSFSVKCEKTGLEFSPSTLNSLFTQRRNLLRPSFYRMLLDVFRFKRDSEELLRTDDYSLTLEHYLKLKGYSPTAFSTCATSRSGSRSAADPEAISNPSRVRSKTTCGSIARWNSSGGNSITSRWPPPAQRPSASIRRSSPPTATRPWRCWPTHQTLSATSSEPSATRRTTPCSTPTPLFCRNAKRPGPAGTTIFPRESWGGLR